jgi:hypothetical protein
MDIWFNLRNLIWREVHLIRQGTRLVTGFGPNNEINRKIRDKARQYHDKYGVYSFQNPDDGTVYYCGSFSPYQNEESGLAGRITKYLETRGGGQDTNSKVFNKINEQIKMNPVAIKILDLSELRIEERDGPASNTFWITSIDNGDIARLIERMMIAFYRYHNQCRWNDD